MTSANHPRASFSQNLAAGWHSCVVVPASRLHGANGLRAGKDGRIYVAQVAGSEISALNPDTGDIEIISPMGKGFTAPDDLVFDEQGNLYATELTSGRVTVKRTNGEYQVLHDDMPCANPITYYRGKLYSGECAPGGRIFESNPDGSNRRLVLENVPMPNAFDFGPDGRLYVPIMGCNEIWAVNIDNGETQVICKDLGVPDSVKFNRQGQIISTQVASGEVFEINPMTGEKKRLVQLSPGLDNCVFIGDRLFVSNMTGHLVEITGQDQYRSIIPEGLQWPMGLAVDTQGTLFIADGGFSYSLDSVGHKRLLGMLFSPGYAGFTRGVASEKPGQWLITTANGDVARFNSVACESEFLAKGLDQPMGVAPVNGGALVAEYGAGRVLLITHSETKIISKNLDKPAGVAVADDHTVYVSDAASGEIKRICGSRCETLIDGLSRPEGIAYHSGRLYCVEVGAKRLIEIDPATASKNCIAACIPVGGPEGVRQQIGAVGVLAGPMTSFTGLTVDANGQIFVAGDADGSVLRFNKLAG